MVFVLLDTSTLDKIDKQRMYNVYDVWPKISEESYNASHNVVDYHDIDHIVFAGMGGSGAIGDIFSSILSKTDVHVCVVKGYILPKTVDKNTMVIATSISGNTTETMSALQSAKKLNCKIAAFSSGGKLQQFCIKNNLEHTYIEQLHSPRSSFTAFLYSMLKTLGPVMPIKKSDIHDSIRQLFVVQKQISSSNLTKKNPALSLAMWISGIPLIYYPWGLQSAAIRFKNSLQENAKSHALIEDVIESCHNGIVAWERTSCVKPILLEGANDHVKTKERWKILKEYFQKNDIGYQEIFSVKGNILSKIICLVYLLDYCSIYKAVLSNVDPSPTKSIDFIKNKIRRISQ